MKKPKPPTVAELGAWENPSTGRNNHAPYPTKKQSLICAFCVYFKEKPRKTFCHFTGDKVQGLNKACEFVEVAYE